jgi:Fe-S-cluster containining protein
MSDDPAAPDPAELLRTLRAALLSIEETRADLVALAARVVALGEQVAVLTPSPAATDAALDARTAVLRPQIAAADALGDGRLHLGGTVDKYQISNADGPPCLEVLPICKGRCCALVFGLSTQDLDEGVIKWDHGQPYLIRHDADGLCTHQVRPTGECGCYHHRPAPCRTYDCRNDARIWVDFERRILAPPNARREPSARFRMESAQDLALALTFESLSLRRDPPKDE